MGDFELSGGLPIDVMPASNGEFFPPPPTEQQAAIMALAGEETDRVATRMGMSRRHATTFATPVMVMPRGGSLSFMSVDLPEHNVVSTSDLFSSKLIGLGEVAPVEGVGKLPDGAYGFYCTVHPGMTGTLVVVG